MADYASEGGHWYEADGTPAYEVLGKNGEMRPTTLRDAKKLNLAPSVSGIIKCAAAEGLEKYKRDQILLAAASNPRGETEGVQAYMNRILEISRQHAATARDLGTLIHGHIEKCLKKDYSWDQAYAKHVNTTTAYLGQWCNGLANLSAEKSFGHPLGFGGKVDVHKWGFVADFKTKDFPEPTLKTWPNQHMQLAAYREGLGMPEARCAIIYVSTGVPGLVQLVECTEKELSKGWRLFQKLLAYWQEDKDYRPKPEKEPEDGERERIVSVI